jgi:phospholipase A-2-activating protein
VERRLPIQVDTATSGTVNLQIGYNTGENPFVAAQRFIDAHVLPQHHLAEIADYITQRVGSAAAHTLGGGGSGGGGRTVPVATTGVPMAFYSYIPSKTYKSFDLSEKTAPTTLEKIKSKIDSFQLLSPEQLAVLTGLLETLGAINRYHATKISDPELDLIAGMLRSFGPSRCFPALDVARMTVLHPDAASAARSAYWSEVARTVAALHARPQGDEGASLDATSQVAVPMLSLRLLSNAFKGGPGSLVAVSSRLEDLVVPLLQAHVSSSNKNVRLSAATLLHNVCHYVQSTAVPASLVSAVLALCREVLTNRSYEGEAIFRTLVAIGTLVMSDSNGSGAREAAASLYLASQVELAASPHGPSVKMAAKEVHSVLA